MEEVRLLSLDERALLALLYYQIPELTEICKPDLSSAINDAGKVHRITQLLHDNHIPSLSTELSEDQQFALKTGVRPEGFKPRIKLNYKDVLSDTDGARLEELFNLGSFVQLGQKTNRPMSTYRLTVPAEHGHELEGIHDRWLENRICILVDGAKGQYWVTPDTLHRHATHQDYVAVPASISPPPRSRPNRITVDGPALALDMSGPSPPSWRDTLDELTTLRPELTFVQTMLNHYLQPAHVQLMNQEAIENKVLLLTYRDKTYRVTGITAQGTLMLTTHLNQGLVYETTLPFRQVAVEGQWQLVEGK